MILKNNELQEYLKKLMGNDLSSFLEAPAEARSIRLNTLKVSSVEQSDFLNKNRKKLKKNDLSDSSFNILDESIPFSLSLDYFKGFFSFQGSSSQIPPLVLNPKPGEKVLDMAASPGSKTTQIAAMMENKGQLIVNDSNIRRMQALNTNTQRSGMINHGIYYLAGERLGRLFPEYFDKVLLDTPCTGLGTLATNKEVYGWWSYNKLKKLTSIQKQLIISAIKATKVGGEIVYSTCSVAPEENELLLDDILKSYPVQIVPIKNKKLSFLDDGFIEYKDELLDPSLKNTKRVWPHKHGMEGFFIARLVKKGEYYNKNSPKNIEFIYTLSFDDPQIKGILQSISENWGIEKSTWQNYRYIKTSDRIWMCNCNCIDFVKEGFSNGGLLLAEERLHMWKLSNQSVQFFEQKISKRHITLMDNEVKELFRNGTCSSKKEENGYFALRIKSSLAAVIYINSGQIKMKIPHSFEL